VAEGYRGHMATVRGHQPRRLAGMGHFRVRSGLHCPDQPSDADQVYRPPEIIGERQEGTLVHLLLDRTERVLDRLAANIKDPGPGGEAYCHAVKHGLAFPPRDAAEVSAGALRLESATVTGARV
jgi:hypothetical protein